MCHPSLEMKDENTIAVFSADSFLGTKLIGAQIPHQEMLIEAIILTPPRIVRSESEATQKPSSVINFTLE